MSIFAFTDCSGVSYPGYVSINLDAKGDVTVSVRAAPTVIEGVFLCCTPGDARCNNYCNMAPSKGPMQDHPSPCVQTIEGNCASFTVPAAEWKGFTQ